MTANELFPLVGRERGLLSRETVGGVLGRGRFKTAGRPRLLFLSSAKHESGYLGFKLQGRSSAIIVFGLFCFIIYIQFLMEAQDLYQPQVEQLFQLHNPHHRTFTDFATFLKQQCRKQPNHTKDFLLSLLNHHPILINFHSFCVLVRTLKKAVVPLKNEECRQTLSEFIIKHGKLYFPYVRHAPSKNFKEWLDLFSDLEVRTPQDLNDQLRVAVFLWKKGYSEEFENRVIQIINNEVLVEKKSQQIKNFKINQFFSPFIVKNIDKLFPQLERLLVRSESNIEVWEEFILTVKNWQGIEPHLFTLVKRIKHLYLSNPESSIKIINSLTSCLKDEAVINELIGYLSSLVGGEHNAKKKIIYIRMLQGVISSLQHHSDIKAKNQFAQDILVTVSNSLIKFTQEEEFIVLVEIIDSLVGMVTEPKDDVAKSLKMYLKSQNKYILIMVGLILTGIYGKDQVDSLPSTKEVFNHFKTQLPTYVKKIDTNWQWLLPVIDFLSNYDLQFIDNLAENLPLFKVSCLALTRPEKKVGLSLIFKKMQQLKNEEEQIEDFFFVALALMLEEVNCEKSWKKLTVGLSSLEKVYLVTRGIFPLTLFNCPELKINKGNQFISLLGFLKGELKTQKVEIESPLDFAKLVICYHDHKSFVKSTFSLANEDQFNRLIERYVRSSLFDVQNDEDSKVSLREMTTIKSVASSLLKYRQDYLVRLLELFTTEDYYKKNLNFLIDFEAEVENDLKYVKNELSGWRDGLLIRQIHKIEDVKPKKLYAGHKFEVKMMSEDEVKQQKYRLHFQKMMKFFDSVADLFLISFNDHANLNRMWHCHLKQMLAITHHPEHRLKILKIVKQSCLFTAGFNKKQKESRIFIKHAQFISDFFAFRNSGITPSVKIMHHCENFLKELLELPFQEENASFKMLEDQDNQFVMLFANEVCEYLLENMEFDLNLKKFAVRFYNKCIMKKIYFGNDQLLFTYLVKNINILASSENVQPVLFYLLTKIDKTRLKEIFADILNFVQATKKLILSTVNSLKQTYDPEFEEFIKLKILSLESNPEISKMAASALPSEVELHHSILNFDMKNFVKKNSKQTIEKLCQFIRDEITAENAVGIFNMVIKASEELFDQGFDQEGLEMLPYFLEINIDHITEELYKPIFFLLATKFTSKEDFRTLNRLSVDVGIDIIKKNAEKHGEQLLLVLESFINKASGVSNIIFLGVLARYLEGNKNLLIIEKRITELFKGNNESDQRSISKCMPDLMSFFKHPLEIVKDILTNIGTMKEEQQVGQSYLFTGLLKGIGYEAAYVYLDKTISNEYITKTKTQKSGRIYLLHAFVENFGRVVEVKAIKIIEIILGYMADSAEEIRNLARRAAQNLILKMSSYSVKILLPQLLKGLEVEQNWRVKISYIWILGIMANCSAKQLQTSLPIIVPSLSICLSNAHPTIRGKASEAMNLIGETIKNPEISQCVDVLIQALENPFQNSSKAIDILLKTNFSHYIDPPSLSMIIPILDYCMRGRSSDLKAGACQVIGSIVELISNSDQLLPYLRIIITGIKISLCDPLPEIRRIASMAIGKISAKIGIKEAEDHFRFVIEIIDSSTSNSIERQGAAQAHAEIICSQTYEYFQEGLYKIFDKLNNVKHSEKEGYILVFLFVPTIKTQEFQGFIKEVNENMYGFVSDEDEVIRNSAMLVEKVLINNYCLSHTDLLLEPLCDGAFDANWKKRNAAIILIGQILNIIKSHMYNTRSNDKSYAYYRGLMAVYIMKDDELEMTRMTANQVWNTYIENTPKTIKIGIEELVKMWTKWTHAAGGIVFKNIIAFSTKYGQNYFTEILEYLPNYLKEPEHQVGVFEILAEFIKRLSHQFLSKESYKCIISSFFEENLFTISQKVRPSLAKCLALYVDKMNEERFFEELLYPVMDKMDQTGEDRQDYTYNLHLLKDLLNTNSNKVVDRVINKIMEPPMSEFKIEVITNNAEKLANYLYSHFKRPATEVLVEQIYSLVGDSTKENRLSLIIYCLEQVSLQLSKKYKTDFIKMINNHITKRIHAFEDGHKAEDKKILQIFVNMVFFFLTSTPLSEIEDLDIIIGQICPIIFLDDEELGVMGHKIYLLVITDSKSHKTAEYIKQMTVSFENKLDRDDQHIWENEQILYDYISILVKGIAYGKEEVMEESLEMVDFMIKHTPRALAEKYILKIVGPIIRISNYPLPQRQKIRIMDLIIFISDSNFKIAPYHNQILSVCLRLLQQFKNNDDILRTVASTYFSLLKNTVHKQELVLSILGRIKFIGNSLVQSFYYFMQSIINEGLDLPKSIFDKIYEEITGVALNSPEKVTVKGAYYASKTSARVGVLLGKPIEKIESQLKGITVSYQALINYLHYAYYKKARVQKMESIEIFLKESNREKIFNLLKVLKLNTENHEQTSKLYNQDYLKSLVPENMIGFEQISDILEDFYTEEKIEEVQAEINET